MEVNDHTVIPHFSYFNVIQRWCNLRFRNLLIQLTMLSFQCLN